MTTLSTSAFAEVLFIIWSAIKFLVKTLKTSVCGKKERDFL